MLLKENENMTKEEQATFLIDAYMNILRLEKAENKDAEIFNQKCGVRAKLEALGVTVDNLEIR